MLLLLLLLLIIRIIISISISLSIIIKTIYTFIHLYKMYVYKTSNFWRHAVKANIIVSTVCFILL